MSLPLRRKALIGLLGGFLMSAPNGCLDNDAIASLVDLTSSTAGSVVQIFVQSGLGRIFIPGASDPDPSLPISEQQH